MTTVTVPRGDMVVGAKEPVPLCGNEWRIGRWERRTCERDAGHGDTYHYGQGRCWPTEAFMARHPYTNKQQREAVRDQFRKETHTA